MKFVGWNVRFGAAPAVFAMLMSVALCASAQDAATSATQKVEQKPRIVLKVADGQTTGPDDAVVVSTTPTDRGVSVTLSTGIVYMDLREGVSSQTLGLGDSAFVHYCGKLAENGAVFDDSREWRVLPGPARVGIGDGKFIKGFEKGIMGMRVGGKRLVQIPPALGYGAKGAPPDIPPFATLLFEIDLVRMARGGDNVTSIGLAAQGIY